VVHHTANADNADNADNERERAGTSGNERERATSGVRPQMGPMRLMRLMGQNLWHVAGVLVLGGPARCLATDTSFPLTWFRQGTTVLLCLPARASRRGIPFNVFVG
jgi:hypothetical protein